MVKMDEEMVKKCLKEYSLELQRIHLRILTIHDELLNTEESITEVAYKKIDYEKVGGGNSGRTDLGDVMLKHKKLLEQRSIELRTEMYRLAEKEESYNRIWHCFQSLSGRGHDFLQRLYVENQPYKAAEAESNVSHKTFESVRKRAIKEILLLYSSDMSNQQVITQSIRREKTRCKTQKKENKEEYMQLGLPLQEIRQTEEEEVLV